jgi:hypothetical protein
LCVTLPCPSSQHYCLCHQSQCQVLADLRMYLLTSCFQTLSSCLHRILERMRKGIPPSPAAGLSHHPAVPQLIVLLLSLLLSETQWISTHNWGSFGCTKGLVWATVFCQGQILTFVCFGWVVFPVSKQPGKPGSHTGRGSRQDFPERGSPACGERSQTLPSGGKCCNRGSKGLPGASPEGVRQVLSASNRSGWAY